MASNGVQLDHKIIYRIVEPGARVLDLGCGTGDLLYLGENLRITGELARESFKLELASY